jgi:hypothetical protein
MTKKETPNLFCRVNTHTHTHRQIFNQYSGISSHSIGACTSDFGGQLGTYQICPMEKGQQTVEEQVIRYKTNIHVYHAYLNHCAGLLEWEDLIYAPSDGMLL